MIAYNIGPGRLVPYSDLGAAPQGATGLRVIQPFGYATQRGRVGECVRQKSEIYSCQEIGCVLTFKTQSEADEHVDTGKHLLEVDCESMNDRVRRKWAGIVTGVTFASDVPSTSWQEEYSSSAAGAPTQRPLGWGLKATKRPSKMTDNVKAFLLKKFEDGARTGNKADPVRVAKEMKTLRNEEDVSP